MQKSFMDPFMKKINLMDKKKLTRKGSCLDDEDTTLPLINLKR